MTVCPIAIAVGCRKCPAFKICPLKGVIGDKPPAPVARAEAKAKIKPKAKPKPKGATKPRAAAARKRK